MTAAQVFPVVTPADIEAMAQFFYTPIMTPTPVATRLPRPADNADTVNGFLRVESADSSPLLQFRSVAWDLSFLIHGYSPNEIEAAYIIGRAMSHAASAHFQSVAGFYIVDVINVFGGDRLPEPRVPDLIRYRAAVTWRVAGHYVPQDNPSLPAQSEQQLIKIQGNPNGGTYLYAFRGSEPSIPLKYNANAQDMEDALCALSTVGAGNLSVVKRSGVPEYDVYFIGALANQSVPLIEVDYSDLNRGSITVEVVVEGNN